MSKPPILKVTSRGLTAHGETLLALLFAGEQVFPDQDWSYEKNDDLTACSAVILDTESNVGRAVWQDLEDSQDRPVRIAYTSRQGEMGTEEFILRKPCRSSDLASLMRDVRAYVEGDRPVRTETVQPAARPRPAPESPPPRRATPPAFNTVTTQAAQAPEPIPDEIAAQLAPGLSLVDSFRLVRWPNFSQLNYTPRHVKLAVLISRQAADVHTLAKSCGLTLSDAISFVNACHKMGYLQVVKPGQVSGPPVASLHPAGAGASTGGAPARSVNAKKLGFLQKIRNRLGL